MSASADCRQKALILNLESSSMECGCVCQGSNDTTISEAEIGTKERSAGFSANI